jgi:glycosyltransferase involved in cell wall biosynthesis
MKLIVQIPCFNEEHTLPQTVADIPRDIEGIDTVEVLIIDDGSSDRTVDVAREIGVDHIIRNSANKGLARTFSKGIEACLKRGADIIVNTDGDNQYAGSSIPDLVRPIVEDRADIVIGDRQTSGIRHFSPLKKLLQKVGSAMVRTLSGIDVRDTVSGFRAYSRDAAIATNVVTEFSYTVETIIQAGTGGMTVLSVPVATNAKTRESRLFKSIGGFIQRQATTMLRSYTMYRSLRVFTTMGAVMMLIGLLPLVRFLFFYLTGEGDGKVQSLVIGSVFITLGYVTFSMALLADSIAMNRRLIERTLDKVRRLELEQLPHVASQVALDEIDAKPADNRTDAENE